MVVDHVLQFLLTQGPVDRDLYIDIAWCGDESYESLCAESQAEVDRLFTKKGQLRAQVRKEMAPSGT